MPLISNFGNFFQVVLKEPQGEQILSPFLTERGSRKRKKRGNFCDFQQRGDPPRLLLPKPGSFMVFKFVCRPQQEYTNNKCL